MTRTKTLLLFALAFSSFTAFVSGQNIRRYDGHKLIRFYPTTADHVEFLRRLPDVGLELDTWKEANPRGDPVDIQVSPDHVKPLLEKTDSYGINYEILMDDIQSHLDRVMRTNAFVRKFQKAATFTQYHEYPQILQWVENRATECGDKCETFDIGTSYEGRELKVIKIGTAGEGKPAVWIDAGIHAREWISTATAMFIIDRLIGDYDSDPVVKELVDTYDWFILPVINADGYVYTWSTDRMWRKTRSTNVTTSCVGVDANRNFEYQWMTIGASSNPCSTTFAGYRPISEPEVVAMRDFILAREDKLEVYLSLHSYGQLFMSPWGYTRTLPADYDDLFAAGQVAVSALADVHSTAYTLGSAANILYESSGTSRDWAKGVPAIKYVYTIELRDTGRYGFILPPEQIQPTGEETWAGIRALVQHISQQKH